MPHSLPPVLVLQPGDSVAVARVALAPGATILAEGRSVTVLDPIAEGHKIAIRALDAGQPVIKYGQPIGLAAGAIQAGQHVHVHNVTMADATSTQDNAGHLYVPTERAEAPATFDGYVRPGGRVGTRNFIGVIASVNCSASVCKAIAQHFTADVLNTAFPGVDGVVAITHGSGCGMSNTGEGFELLRRTLLGYARHPNFAAVLLVGLGCEVNQVAALAEALLDEQPGRVRTLSIQDAGGTREAIEQGKGMVQELAAQAATAQRTAVPAHHLAVGLQCGGSDGYSGISVNPALGAAVDLLVRHGGTAILSETPEIFGAEHLLTARAASAEVAAKLMERLHWWQNYTQAHGASMNNNPSPGNKAGGITTILEKSLGAVAKGGGSGLMDVYGYAEPVRSPGLVFMDTPGYDPVSATGQIAGGANLVCFTTGRGSTFGAKPVPSIKLASNTAMYRRMVQDMDFNAGQVVDGALSIQAAGEQIFRLMLDVASGRRTASELLSLGDNEFVPWQLGAVM